ncbi:MAG TPA: hypothetical protein PKD54_11930, partial [Pirellulaceae bacterium]|nr:hypothetical protein [Pirellulaceae bacterium]
NLCILNHFCLSRKSHIPFACQQSNWRLLITDIPFLTNSIEKMNSITYGLARRQGSGHNNRFALHRVGERGTLGVTPTFWGARGPQAAGQME